MAKTNISRNRTFYRPFLLTIILTATMFCSICSIGHNSAFTGEEAIKEILQFGMVIVGIFALIFIFYTNSFLMKRRQKELGLYHILGLEKRHIRKILAWETLMLSATGLAGGLGAALLFDRLMFLVVLKVFRYPVTISYQIDPTAFWMTGLLFFFIFFLIFCSNVRRIRKSSGMELLKSQQTGEREPRVRWILAVLGVLFTGTGYYLANSVDNIISALSYLLIAVLLVAAGTYFLFLAGSIALLKILKKKKNYYYRTNHFIAVSGMIYRMKQNAVGLANICILSTGVLLVLSTTVSIYSGVLDIIHTRYPWEISIHGENQTKEKCMEMEKTVKEVSEVTGLAIEQEQKEAYQDQCSKFAYEIHFDVEGKEEDTLIFHNKLLQLMEEKKELSEFWVECRDQNMENAYSFYGSFLFLGVYLGTLFLMATVLIIYYKQVIEGYEDRERYAIMQKVGMDQREVRRSVRSQILIMFFLPLGTALVHCLAAFHLMAKVLEALYMYHVALYAKVSVCVAAVFILVYLTVYLITARSYYRIVRTSAC